MTWSVFYGQKIGPNDGYEPELFNELEVVDKQRNLRTTYGLVNVEPKLQDLQLKYLQALMTHKNPYTGLRPVDNPEIAVVEFQNEDTVFFFNPLNGLKDARSGRCTPSGCGNGGSSGPKPSMALRRPSTKPGASSAAATTGPPGTWN